MRRSGLLHAELNRVIAAMGHTDTLVIADAGLPIPHGVPCIDLALIGGLPSFAQVFDAIWTELAVEAVTFAEEIEPKNPSLMALAKRLIREGIEVEKISHADFKRRCANAYAVVRTGETAPYANVILHAGVTF